ncbi:hypothetical protein AMK59_4064 [Oryctes borbonicus]|uniref:Uncharacterized protein n=1 Tax=Oryctes borbonicus TaxID=1629725 RepID=A0A0T6B6W6_9SCAR|nr:hypothetical protein AMK59_4064 [Oryctes borbonicus]
MYRLLILTLFLTKTYAGTITHDIDEGESSSSLEVHHGGKHDYGYALGDSDSTRNGIFGHEGSYGEDDQSGYDENQGGGEGYGHQDYGSQGGNDNEDGFGGQFQGNYGGYDDGEGGGSESDDHKNY